MTKKFRVVIEFTQNRVKNNTKLMNFMKLSQIKKYSGEEGSNPRGNKGILRYFLEFNQIG